MTPDEIRELRCECGHGALALHSHICWSSICRCERSVAEVLASALTERLAQAWDEAHELLCDCFRCGHLNPYRSHADSGRSAGALSDEQGSARVVGRGEGSGAQKGDEA